MHYSLNAIVRYKKSVLEPQGKAVLLSLKGKGHEKIQNVRVGKMIELTIEADNEKDAINEAEKMATELLYNPVMEICEISIVK